ncbi:MAG: hypothetical protein OEZ39_08185 [Gammaproteobacteria bacterium]|nr:hypothetical protein [Gammaproteobacteria bacterium]MDH5651839.1 hypothetical protein [Gammaproteobacteria bacterium]
MIKDSIGTTNIEEGADALIKLIDDIKHDGANWNEANTRFHFIDPFITNCLGWYRVDIRVEESEHGTYTDYELGSPRSLIVEAKKEGIYFELPANPEQKPIANLRSVMMLDRNVESAIKQVQGYCSSRGTPVAVVCNGHQLIAFLASRLDGESPLDGKCLVINGLENFVKHFPLIWQNLSPSGLQERRIIRLLTTGKEIGIPKKISTFLTQYPSFRYKSDIQASLRTVAELLIEDVVRTQEVESKFFKECYCESGALARDALISKQILAARYAALFSEAEPSPKLSPVIPEKDQVALTPEVMAEAIARRPIVLIGDVGVGKSSFMKHLMYVSAYEEFQQALYVYIDLGSQAAFESNLKDFVIDEIEKQLLERYKIDVFQENLVHGIYNVEIGRFRNSIHGGLYETDRNQYDEKLREFIVHKLENKPQHLQKAVNHIVKGRQKQVVLMIDNADQRNMEVQQEAFLIGQNLSQHWQAVVFIAVRPQTFHHSKRAGTFSAYPQKAFSISPPRADMVIEKRLRFALDMAEGRLPIEQLKGVQLNFKSLALFLKALLYSLKNNSELVEILSNITGGNIRLVVDLVIKFIGSPNVDAEKIISIMEKTDNYIIPVHEFSKSALLGEYSHYHSDSSVAMNMFDVRFPDEREHFLVPMITGYLNYDGEHRNREGFVNSNDLIMEMQNWSFTKQQTESALRRMTNKRLIETTERVTFDEDITGLIGEMPSAFRITTVGAYHLLKWVTSFSYLDAMVFDTPIFEERILDELSQNPGSFEIHARYNRTTKFRTYLSTVWHNSGLAPAYFDWTSLIPAGKVSFDMVDRAISRARQINKKY